MTEAEFQEIVVDLARMLGWRHMHVRRSIGKGRRWTTATNVPWPDLTLWRTLERSRLGVAGAPFGATFLIRELKVDLKSAWQPGQRELLSGLRASGVDAGVWYVADLDSGLIQRELGARRRDAA